MRQMNTEIQKWNEPGGAAVEREKISGIRLRYFPSWSIIKSVSLN